MESVCLPVMRGVVSLTLVMIPLALLMEMPLLML